jgi:UDP-2,4-diacetamido-2,4,6-trideoxy-beta-L-altropyranose hydrolase
MGRPGPLTAEQRHLPQVRLRPAQEEDSARLLALRNDPDAVGFSVSGRAVTVEEHERWFRRVRDDPAHHRLWIAEQGGEPVGQVRVDITGGTGTVSIAVEAGHRGRGVGTSMLQAVVAQVGVEGAPSRLTSVVRSDNAASLRAFAAAGFRQVATGAEFLELEWP